MSFRFQKRVRIAPGLRLNISKGGLSTSAGVRGASVTLGRHGLYGNFGAPETGLSYRKKLNKKTGGPTNTWYQNDSENVSKTISMKYDKQSYSLVFVDEDDQRIPATVERDIKREFRDDIKRLYVQKEKEINEQTTKLLVLHKQTLKERSLEELRNLAAEAVVFTIQQPSEKVIFEELKTDFEEQLSFLEKIRLLLPSNRRNFLSRVENEANHQYQLESDQFQQAQDVFEEEKMQRLNQVETVIKGEIEVMELWLENFLAELDFPLETNVSFSILSNSTVCLDVDLPQMEEIPLTKASILKSGKLKVKNKSQRQMREDYAFMVGGTALYLSSYVFSLLPTCETIIISGYTQVQNKATGHIEDQYIYSLKVNKKTFYSLNLAEVHPIAAFDNFEPVINATKTFIFKEIEPYQPVEK